MCWRPQHVEILPVLAKRVAAVMEYGVMIHIHCFARNSNRSRVSYFKPYCIL